MDRIVTTGRLPSDRHVVFVQEMRLDAILAFDDGFTRVGLPVIPAS